MTTQAIELKKKERSDIHFQWAIKELETNKETYSRKKMDVICRLASKLEEEAKKKGINIKSEIKYAEGKSVVKSITEYANKNHIDLIVIGGGDVPQLWTCLRNLSALS